MAEASGVYAAAVTPRRKDTGEIDIGAGLELIDFLEKAHVNGIVLLGTTGEFVHFPTEERARFAAMAIKRSRVPVSVNVSHSSLDTALWLGELAADAGAAAVVIMPPYFFRYTQGQVKAFLERFADGMDGRVPLMLYNIPFFTNEIAVETSLELLRTGRWAGIKDSSGNRAAFEILMREKSSATSGFSLMVGNDTIFAEARAAGASGVVSGCASAVPELLVALDHAITAGDSAKAARMQTLLAEFVQQVDRFPAPVAIREAVTARGIAAGPPAVPLPPGDERELAAFREWFLDWLPSMRREAGA